MAEKRKNYVVISTDCDAKTKCELVSATEQEIDDACNEALYILASDVSKALKKKPAKLENYY